MNWGKSIVLVFIVFAGFIGSMVYLMVSQRVDLVREDYYQDEIAYQKQIDRVARTARLSRAPALALDVNRQQIALNLPAGWEKGKLTFYRPSDSLKDQTIQLVSNQQTVSTAGLITGIWRAQLSWSANGEDYYYEQTLTQP
ncbi:FixH family protein [Fibrivirga algicola]|uniref:Nitrogen fixation protein FixH n=1 Tax=Fibrivirga algicola TaxID=2950420 RepID=A0ABX0QES2_9BACT|nr:FixH family protein [Fibrivirga algicola]NID10699.1 nitrogen fixation protein FixH [Fibrivirga algicola]